MWELSQFDAVVHQQQGVRGREIIGATADVQTSCSVVSGRRGGATLAPSQEAQRSSLDLDLVYPGARHPPYESMDQVPSEHRVFTHVVVAATRALSQAVQDRLTAWRTCGRC